MTEYNEWTLSEQPALATLQALGFSFAPPDALEVMRQTARSAVLIGPLREAIRRLNPWIRDDNVDRVVRAVTEPVGSTLLERNRAALAAITGGVNVRQADQGPHDVTVQVIDFDTRSLNEYTVTNQFRVLGTTKDVIFDVVAFVNGLPLAVIECKSPKIKDPLLAGVQRLRRYQELDEWAGQGAPTAFLQNALLISCCGEGAVYGALGAGARHFAPFPDLHPPELLPELEAVGPVRAQEVLLGSVLAPESLLQFTRNLTAFEVERGRLLKKLARHQQRIAIDLTVHRLLTGQHAVERGGIIWHTQGSGKSLTMVWLATRMRQAVRGNPTLLVVTDRTDLDDQISGTFRRVGLREPDQAPTVQDLRLSLRGAARGSTILTTVQKFHDVQAGEVLNDSADIVVLVDEAHRSHYGPLAARMRQTLPNATFVAFTGTPIDKKSRSTLQEFGGYIHTYTLEQAVRDEVTVPIYYEARELERWGIEGKTLDALFDRAFMDYSEDERELIRAKYATLTALAGTPKRITALALDIADHFAAHIEPNGLKAQVVAGNRETAVKYFDALQAVGAPEAAVIFTAGPEDGEALAAHHRSKAEQRALIERFKNPADPLKFLIVVDMLLTGFDAPIEGVMYLDAPLREHTLLQAIARVNRRYQDKDAGLIVDYWGVGALLREALSLFDPGVLNDPMPSKAMELPRLEARHAAAMRFFEGQTQHGLEACLQVIEPEDVRARFNGAFKLFAQSLNIMYPDPMALRFEEDFKWLGALRQVAAARFRDPTLELAWGDVAEKVRRLIDEYVSASGVVQLLAPVSILSSEFERVLQNLGSDRARASEVQHALRHEINVRQGDSPRFYLSLRERLEQLIEARRQLRISEAEELRQSLSVLAELRAGPAREAALLGLSESAYALYGWLDGVLPENVSVQTARDAEALLQGLVVVDWTQKPDVEREMRRLLRRLLLAAGMPRDGIEPVLVQLLDVARRRWRQ